MFGILKRLTSWPWFSRPIKTVPADAGWEGDSFFGYTAVVNGVERNLTTAEAKSRRLTEIAQERAAIRANEKAIKASKKSFYQRLRNLSTEELKIETGRLTYIDGKWVES